MKNKWLIVNPNNNNNNNIIIVNFFSILFYYFYHYHKVFNTSFLCILTLKKFHINNNISDVWSITYIILHSNSLLYSLTF